MGPLEVIISFGSGEEHTALYVYILPRNAGKWLETQHSPAVSGADGKQAITQSFLVCVFAWVVPKKIDILLSGPTLLLAKYSSNLKILVPRKYKTNETRSSEVVATQS
jgi:hypothetical protein